MKTRFLISPAYLLSVACLITGAIMAGTALMVIGWIVFVVGLGINVMALVVLANREALYKAQLVGTVPKARSTTDQATPARTATPETTADAARPAQPQTAAAEEDSAPIFPKNQ